MRADVLVPRAGRGLAPPSALYTYAVPDALAAELAAGQLVAVPFGDRTLPGIVWALDASDDLADPSVPASAGIRPIGRILLPEPHVPTRPPWSAQQATRMTSLATRQLVLGSRSRGTSPGNCRRSTSMA